MAIKGCSCPNVQQDNIHGQGQRVFNKTTKGWRCTSCGVAKESNSVEKKETKKK